MHRNALILLLLAAAAPATAQQTPPAQPPAPPGQVACTMPRPQICTAQYQPVCATKRDGARQTYPNACFACIDASVVSHIPGPC